MARGARKSKDVARQRHLARLAAVQALYQIEISGQRPELVAVEFLRHRRYEALEGLDLSALDPDMFRDLVVAVSQEAEALDDMLSAVLAEDWPVERLELLVKIILRLGAYELAYRPEIPVGVVINECVDLTHAYFSGKQPGLVNGVLDRLSSALHDEGQSGAGAARLG